LSSPASSPLFPYTTLFRSKAGLGGDGLRGVDRTPASEPDEPVLVRRRPHRLPDHRRRRVRPDAVEPAGHRELELAPALARDEERDRKSTRLNSSHEWISYA